MWKNKFDKSDILNGLYYLEDFEELENGWDFYDALPISKERIKEAQEFLIKIVASIYAYDLIVYIFPVPTGDILFEIQKIDGISIEVYIEFDGIDILFIADESSDNYIEYNSFPMNEAIKIIKHLLIED